VNPKDIVLQYVAAFNRGDIDGLCRLFAPEALIWGVFGWGSVDKVRPIWEDLIDCLQMSLQVDALIAEENTVAARYTERGRSAKAFKGFEPTGRSYEITAMEWFEVRDGLIQRRWGARDSASQFRQLGFTA